MLSRISITKNSDDYIVSHDTAVVGYEWVSQFSNSFNNYDEAFSYAESLNIIPIVNIDLEDC